jgi:fumarate reductase flavoprotein subunit
MGLQAAQALGAAVSDLSAFYGHVLAREALVNPQLWPYPQLDELAITGVVVDAEGRRVADEGLGGVHLANMMARREDPLACFVVFDQHIWDTAGRAGRIPANPHLLRGGATMLEGDSLESLARSMGVPPGRLAETVERYNQALRAGELDHLEPARTSTKHTPAPISAPPYYALPACVGITFTTGGVAIDGDGRVKSTQGGIVRGLYAAGSATGGLEGGPKAGYVGGLMKALVFGIRAAEHVAGHAVCPSS